MVKLNYINFLMFNPLEMLLISKVCSFFVLYNDISTNVAIKYGGHTGNTTEIMKEKGRGGYYFLLKFQPSNQS